MVSMVDTTLHLVVGIQIGKQETSCLSSDFSERTYHIALFGFVTSDALYHARV